MMLSLPTITPRADSTLWPSIRTIHPSQIEDSAPPTSPNQAQRRRNSHSHHHHAQSYHSSRTLLAQLMTEENQIEARKTHIQRYGATWIRPPGVQKTYQAIQDEDEERKEQEALARREQVMMDLAAAQQDAQNAEERAQNDEDMDEGEERDLDDEVPEAEADESDMSGSDDSASEVEEDDTRTAEVTFNEDSFIEGSMVEGQVTHMLAMEEASMSGALQEERDLDDDVPEAGSYEHTDSSLIDSSSEAEQATPASMVAPARRRSDRRRSGRRSSGRMSSGPRQASAAATFGQHFLPQNSRTSLDFAESSSILEGSSFLRSSPAAARAPSGSLRTRFLGARGAR